MKNDDPVTVVLGARDRETIRSAVQMMADRARCGGGFDDEDWEDVERVLSYVREPSDGQS